eukprot:gene5971-9970_t
MVEGVTSASFTNHFSEGINIEYVPKFTEMETWQELNLNLFEIFQNPSSQTNQIEHHTTPSSTSTNSSKYESPQLINIFNSDNNSENSPQAKFYTNSPNLPDSPIGEDLDSEESDPSRKSDEKTIGRAFSLFTKQKSSDPNMSATNIFENLKNKLNIKKELLSVKRENSNSGNSLSTRFRKGTFFQRTKYEPEEKKKTEKKNHSARVISSRGTSHTFTIPKLPIGNLNSDTEPNSNTNTSTSTTSPSPRMNSPKIINLFSPSISNSTTSNPNSKLKRKGLSSLSPNFSILQKSPRAHKNTKGSPGDELKSSSSFRTQAIGGVPQTPKSTVLTKSTKKNTPSTPSPTPPFCDPIEFSPNPKPRKSSRGTITTTTTTSSGDFAKSRKGSFPENLQRKTSFVTTIEKVDDVIPPSIIENEQKDFLMPQRNSLELQSSKGDLFCSTSTVNFNIKSNSSKGNSDTLEIPDVDLRSNSELLQSLPTKEMLTKKQPLSARHHERSQSVAVSNFFDSNSSFFDHSKPPLKITKPIINESKTKSIPNEAPKKTSWNIFKTKAKQFFSNDSNGGVNGILTSNTSFIQENPIDAERKRKQESRVEELISLEYVSPFRQEATIENMFWEVGL